MPLKRALFTLKSYLRLFFVRTETGGLRWNKNLPGVVNILPGRYDSPLLDIQNFDAGSTSLPHDGEELWQHIALRSDEQQAYFQSLLDLPDSTRFSRQKTAGRRYYSENGWFPVSDAFTLSAIVRKERPRRFIEVGSGYSTAVLLDTLEQAKITVKLTFIEPNPERLYSLLSPQDQATATIICKDLQSVPVDTFAQLEASDILFIDSSHVAKIGSDVTYIFLRVLPMLKPGVLVHFHDIFFPVSYPAEWIREGRAWNESLFLRAFLVCNSQFQIVAFNAFAASTFPQLFANQFPVFIERPGSSFWIRKVS